MHEVMFEDRFFFCLLKNPNITKLGQRVGLSEKDILKINEMYGTDCEKGKVPANATAVNQMLDSMVSMIFGLVTHFG
jgi:hypothetical protein